MRKGTWLILSMALSLGCLAACGSHADEGKTVVTFQSWNPADHGPDSPIYKIIESFEKENPDITVKYTFINSDTYSEHLRVNLLGSDAPDIFGISSALSFDAYRSYEEDLTPYCKKAWGDNWQDKFLDSCIDNVCSDGKVYGLPLGQTYAGCLWADVNLLEQFGCTVPTSYSEMLATCRTLRDNGQSPLAIGAKTSWLNLDMWMSIAADIDRDALYDAIEGRASFESEAVKESFRIWQDCFNNGVFQDKAAKMPLYDKVNDMFQREGSVAMFANGSWAMNMYTVKDEKTRANFDREGANHEVFMIDWNDDGTVAPLTASVDVILCLNPESEHKDAAFRFMEYLVTEGQKLLVNEYLEYMPTLADFELDVQGLSEDGVRNLEYIIESGKTNVAGERGIKYEDLSIAVCNVLDALANNRITPEEAASEVQEVSRSIVR